MELNYLLYYEKQVMNCIPTLKSLHLATIFTSLGGVGAVHLLTEHDCMLLSLVCFKFSIAVVIYLS